MNEIKTTRYYGKLFRQNDNSLHFVVKLVCPPKCPPSQYIGPKCKTCDLLCVDDTLLFCIPNLSIDWSEVNRVR